MNSYLNYFYDISEIGAALDIPLGAWSDKWGRRKIYQWGIAASLFSLLPYLLSKDVIFLLVAALLNAFALALNSGSLEAIVSAATHNSSDVF